MPGSKKGFKLSTRVKQVQATLDEAKHEFSKPESSRDYARAVGQLMIAQDMIQRIVDFTADREVSERRQGL